MKQDMRHASTFIILLFFERSKSKTSKAIATINATLAKSNLSTKSRLPIILQCIEDSEMNEFFFFKPFGRKRFEQQLYDRFYFEQVNLEVHDVQCLTKDADTNYVHGRILFKIK